MALISIVEYMHDLKEAGFTDRQSEVQARRLELVIANVTAEIKSDIKQEFHVDDLVRKQDLDLAIERIIAGSDLSIRNAKIDLEISIEKLRTDSEISIEKLRTDLEISIEKLRTDLELSIDKVRTDSGISIEKLRTDLELSIEKLRYEMLKFTIWTGVAVIMAMAGMFAKGFHWI